MTRISVSILIFFLLYPFFVFGQTVSGVITDAETGDLMPSATVMYEGTFRGTIANLDGEFSIEIGHFPAVLLIRYIGYESERIELDQWQDEPFSIRLKPSVYEMEEVVVTDRDPGLSIMERVIERKKIWRAALRTYEVDAFTRQVLRNDTTIVSITESGTRSFWDAEQGHREVQLFRHQTTNIGEDQNFAGVRFLPNFYDDNITIAGYNVVGITHPDALRFYDFRLIEMLQIDGQPVYKIDVIPRRKLQPLFEGTVYVLGSEYALLEVDVKPNDVVNFPPPVQEFDLSYRQQFNNFGEDFWLPVDMRISGTIKISMIGLRFPAIRFSQTSNLAEYRVNVELPDSLYQEEQVFRRADTDTTIDFSRQLIPLTTEERVAYESIDSTNTLEKAFEPEGFLAGLIRIENDDSESVGPGRFLPGGLGVEGRFNRVDGFNAGLTLDQDLESIGMEAGLFGSYSFHAKYINYGLSLRQEIPFYGTDSRFLLKGAYENEIRPRSARSLYPGFMNSGQSLLGGADYFDYLKSRELSGGIEIQKILPRTDLSVLFSTRQDRSIKTNIESVFDYSLFGLHKTRPANNPVWDGRLNYLQFELNLNNLSYDFGFSGGRGLRLLAEHSSPGIGSDFDYTSVHVFADWNLNTFFSRRVFANTLDLKISAGHAFGNLPPQRLGIIDGRMGMLTPFGVLKTKSKGPYEGSSYWTFTGEHNFRTVPFELIGLRSLADRGWGIILFGGAGYAEAEDDIYAFNPRVTDGIHSEAGVSLNSIFGVLRIDFAMRLDAPGSYIGISLPRYF